MTPRSAAPALPDTLRTGVLLALATALLSGVSIWVNAFAVKQVPDPAVYTTIKNGIAAILLVALMAVTVRPVTIRSISSRAWAGLLVIGVVGGSVPFILFFTGLAQASAPSAAFIHKTLFVWVALLAAPFLGERLGGAQLAALGVLLVGQAFVLTPAGVAWGTGETMIAAATLLWAVETVVARRVLRDVPSAVVGACRLGIGLVVLAGFLGTTGRLSALAALSGTQWAWATLTGAFLFGYVATWFAALQRAPASLVTAILVLGAPVTAVIQLATTGNLPTPAILAGQSLIVAAGVALAVPAFARRRDPTATPVPATPG
jgi:drug/metabolite transporter (DMT)-like permease